MKYLCFDWDFSRVRCENRACDILYNDHDKSQAHVAPIVLDHLTENGRPIGLVLEKIEGTFASIKDKANCEKLSASYTLSQYFWSTATLTDTIPLWTPKTVLGDWSTLSVLRSTTKAGRRRRSNH